MEDMTKKMKLIGFMLLGIFVFTQCKKQDPDLYKVTFKINDKEGVAIEGVTVSLNGYENVQTNSEGIAIIENVLAADSISYVIEKEPYGIKNGKVSIQNNDISVVVEWVIYDLTFVVKNRQGNPIEGAKIIVNDYNGVSDHNGVWQLKNVMPTEINGYSVSKDGFQTETGNLYYSSKNVEKTIVINEIFIDNDGNSYATVIIGSQIWMAEDLITTTYIDGTPILNITDNGEWGNLTTGAYCWFYNDKEKNSEAALYNWYAISSSKLCPSGWHIPNDEEWKELEMNVGMTKVDVDKTGFRGTNEGSKLSSGYWNSGALIQDPDFNSSGFNGNGTGGRTELGNWKFDVSYRWTLSEFDNEKAWYRSIIYNKAGVNRDLASKKSGFAVRFVKDY